MELFPAVLIGGPPNSGKSVLTANLTQALRRRGVQHYVLRACPDGEGDWTHTADQERVRTIIVPRAWTPAFVDHVCRDLKGRHLPLIVDVGGRPRPWQEPIFDHCTHAILLTPDEASRLTWLDLIARHGLPCLADLRSALKGEARLEAERPVLRGTLVGLEWGVQLHNPLFEALTGRLAQLFAYDAQLLRQTHLRLAPVETTVDLDRLARTLGVPHHGRQAAWGPRHLPIVLDYLPEATPLGLYGRGPNWLYAALALHAYPQPVYQFDVRLGWVQPPALRHAMPRAGTPLQATVTQSTGGLHLEFTLPAGYLDYGQAEGLAVPPVPPGRGLILSGKLPHWLLTALAVAYRAAPWLAIYQPQQGNRAVVIHSRVATPTVGAQPRL